MNKYFLCIYFGIDCLISVYPNIESWFKSIDKSKMHKNFFQYLVHSNEIRFQDAHCCWHDSVSSLSFSAPHTYYYANIIFSVKFIWIAINFVVIFNVLYCFLNNCLLFSVVVWENNKHMLPGTFGSTASANNSFDNKRYWIFVEKKIGLKTIQKLYWKDKVEGTTKEVDLLIQCLIFHFSSLQQQRNSAGIKNLCSVGIEEWSRGISRLTNEKKMLHLGIKFMYSKFVC